MQDVCWMEHLSFNWRWEWPVHQYLCPVDETLQQMHKSTNINNQSLWRTIHCRLTMLHYSVIGDSTPYLDYALNSRVRLITRVYMWSNPYLSCLPSLCTCRQWCVSGALSVLCLTCSMVTKLIKPWVPVDFLWTPHYAQAHGYMHTCTAIIWHVLHSYGVKL